MDERFFVTFIHCFFIAFGVMIGGAVLGSLGAFLTGGSPLHAMVRISQSIRIWAVVAAIGGTFDAIESFQKGFLEGETFDLLKQFLYILSAMFGARFALLLISWITSEELS